MGKGKTLKCFACKQTFRESEMIGVECISCSNKKLKENQRMSNTEKVTHATSENQENREPVKRVNVMLDTRLSLHARALCILILELQGDYETWGEMKGGIESQCSEGRTIIDKAVKELREYRYLHLQIKSRDAWEYTITDNVDPEVETLSEELNRIKIEKDKEKKKKEKARLKKLESKKQKQLNILEEKAKKLKREV